MGRPIYFDQADQAIKEMTDTDMIRLAYYAQVAYATWVSNVNNRGSIYIGGPSGDATYIGNADDTISTVQTDSVVKPGTETTADDNAWPPYPGIGSSIASSYYYQEKKTPNADDFGGNGLPNAIWSDKWSYLTYDNNTKIFRPAFSYAYFSEILNVIDTQMRTNSVGTFYVQDASNVAGLQSIGGAGTWSDMGMWYNNTTYSAGATQYNLYLKRTLTSVPGDDIKPLGFDEDGPGAGPAPNDWGLNYDAGTRTGLWQGVQPTTTRANFKEKKIQDYENLCLKILLNYMIYRNDSVRPVPYYTVRTVAPPTPDMTQRGTWYDTKQTTSSDVQSFVHPNYISTSTPTGTAATVNHYELIMQN